MEESLSKFIGESAKRHDENSNLMKEIRSVIDAAIRNQRASIKALEIQIGQMSKVLQERGSGSLPSSIEKNPRDHVKSISNTVETDTPSIRRIEPVRYAISSHQNRMQIFKPSQPIIHFPIRLMIVMKRKRLGELTPTKLIIELADRTIKHPKGIAENVLVGIDKFVFLVDFVVLDMPEDIEVPLILGRPFLSTAYAKIDVFKRKNYLKSRGLMCLVTTSFKFITQITG
ncbi:hypothetical protein Tco_1048603 [Tanacetum coccineum]